MRRTERASRWMNLGTDGLHAGPALGLALGLALALSTTAIAGCLGESEAHEVAPAESGLAELRPVQGDYPVTGSGGEVTCAEYEYDGPQDGLTYMVSERYVFSKMAALLETDEEFKQAALSQGLGTVATCGQARRMKTLWREHIEARPSLEHDQVAEDPDTRITEELVEKIADGRAYSHRPTVRLVTWKSASSTENVFGCSGVFIADRVILSAAHCFPSDARMRITVRSADGCVFPKGADCNVDPGNNLVTVTRHPLYSGNAFHDIAVLELPEEPGSPMNDSANWMRIATKNASRGQRYWQTGWGANNHNGDGSNTLRLTNRDIGIDWVGDHHFIYNVVRGEGRGCKGDSGGPMIATGLASANVVMGLNVEGDLDRLSDACPSPGEKVRSTALVDNVAWIEGQIGRICQEFSGNAGFTYKRCW